jgi:hypothetical protein
MAVLDEDIPLETLRHFNVYVTELRADVKVKGFECQSSRDLLE